MKALIVDDEPTVRLLLSRILRREVDCAVTEATNGIEALDLLARHHFDFVVIDIMMPIMDGIETLEAIRNTPQLRTLPVMVLSAVRDEAQVRQLVSLGVSAYLTKPLRPSDASARVQRFVASLGASTHAPQQGQGRTLLGLPDGAQILVVDGDADFRHFVRSTLGHQYVIAEAEGGAQGLRACLDGRPAAILLGQNLGAVPAPLFLRKLRSLPTLASVPVVVAGSRGNEAPLADADAIIQRTFVPEAFKKQFARLVTGGSPEQRVLLARPELRPQMISATEQVFGMMLGIEVFADAVEPPPPAAGADHACVVLSLPAEDSDLEFGVATAREMSERMTALFLQGAEVVTDEDVASTLQEVANIISGRLQNALRGRGDEVTIGLPLVSVLAETLAVADTWAGVGFHNAAGDIRFTAYLRPVPRHAPTTAGASAS
ncbi:response regulator [Luteitalea sp. TBR-22]|uniref:response regulator n=1 Tax=Luteitalea sp. TBR-22 TaxID=2802971 RepID=UPI001EF664B3|nr:response regulator [Luteitalea sp. TBR-22]